METGKHDCLVTGSAGFIGYHLCEALLRSGHRVYGIDSLNAYYDPELKMQRRKRLQRHPNFSDVIGQIENPTDLKKLIAGRRFNKAFHFAAQAGVRYSLEHPQSYLQSNVQGSWQVLDALSSTGVDHLLVASTSSVYGASKNMPFKESERTGEPLNIYSATKIGMEAMAYSYASLHEIPTTVLRFFTVYGPWGRPDMALFKFSDSILNGRPIDVYGEGRMKRDFTYVDDLVEAILRLSDIVPGEKNRLSGKATVDSLSSGVPYRIVNIGKGQPTGLMDFIGALEKALGKQAVKRFLPMQKGEMEETFADTRLLHELTGYLPSTRLADGVSHFVEWFKTEYKATQGRRSMSGKPHGGTDP
jgi:UDP-glucuronate 4-epimerase